MYWNTIVIILSLMLLLFLLWKETSRQNKAWLTARIIASAIAVLSLAFIALPLKIKKQSSYSNAITILLTEGFSADSLSPVLKANPDVKIYTTDKAITAFNAAYLPGLNDLMEKTTGTDEVHIFGYGMEEDELALLKMNPVVFHPAVIENTITDISWTQKIRSGEKLLIQGRFDNTASNPVKIVLSGFNTSLDSVILKPKQNSPFQLSTIPRHIEKAVYSITVLSAKDSLEKNPVPIEVISIKPLSILLLASSPDFENKFLKNWLAQNEYKFAVRTSISKSKYEKQFVNMPPLSLERVTGTLLEKFDLVIADADVLAALPATDIAAIRNHVESKGMGLIVKAGNAEKKSLYSVSFPLVESRDSIRHSIKLSFGDSSHSTSPLLIEQPLFIRHFPGTQSLFTDQQKRIVTNSKMIGSGKVIFTTIPNTFSWQLSGNSNDYTGYWSLLLTKAAKKIRLPETWNIKPALPKKNHEVELTLQSSGETIPQLQIGIDMVYPQQVLLLPFEWKASWWPVKTGWEPLIGNLGKDFLYVYDDNDWKGINRLQKLNATKKYAAQFHTGIKDHIKVAASETGIPKFYFFLIFIAFSGFLWFEKKYRNG